MWNKKKKRKLMYVKRQGNTIATYSKYGNNAVTCTHSSTPCRECKAKHDRNPLAIFSTTHTFQKGTKILTGPDLLTLLQEYKTGDHITIEKFNTFHDQTNYR